MRFEGVSRLGKKQTFEPHELGVTSSRSGVVTFVIISLPVAKGNITIR